MTGAGEWNELTGTGTSGGGLQTLDYLPPECCSLATACGSAERGLLLSIAGAVGRLRGLDFDYPSRGTLLGHYIRAITTDRVRLRVALDICLDLVALVRVILRDASNLCVVSGLLLV